jgi:hypothetical protein
MLISIVKTFDNNLQFGTHKFIMQLGNDAKIYYINIYYEFEFEFFVKCGIFYEFKYHLHILPIRYSDYFMSSKIIKLNLVIFLKFF